MTIIYVPRAFGSTLILTVSTVQQQPPPINVTWVTRDLYATWKTRDDKATWITRDDKATWKARN